MLVICDLFKIYVNGVCVLCEVMFDILYGMFGLFGFNGVGKLLLMCMIVILQDLDCGSIMLDGQDLLVDKLVMWCLFGYLLQEFGVYLKVLVEVMFDYFVVFKGVIVCGEWCELVYVLLCQVNLWDVCKCKFGMFFGGMCQCFGIVQVLIGVLWLVIVDEFIVGFDLEECNCFFNLLVEIGECMVVILFIYIVEDVIDLCLCMVIFVQGQVLFIGELLEVIVSFEGCVW